MGLGLCIISLETISDIAPVEVVFNEGRFGYLDYSHHVSFTELSIISQRSEPPVAPRGLVSVYRGEATSLVTDIVTSVCDATASTLFLLAPLLTILLTIIAFLALTKKHLLSGFLDTFFISIGILLGQTSEKSVKVKHC